MELTIGLVALVCVAAVLYYNNKSKEKGSVPVQPEPEVAPYKVEPVVNEVVPVVAEPAAEPAKEAKPKKPKKPAAAKKPAGTKAPAKKTKTKKSV